jgi:hypothetical protein
MRKGSRARNSWLGIWADACSWGFEASSVIGFLAMKLAVGGKAAATEAQRIASEKIEASLALQSGALSGGLGATSLSAAGKRSTTTGKRCARTRDVLPKAPLYGHIDRNEDG